MKNLFFFLALLLITGCSKSEINDSKSINNQIFVTSIIRKNYNLSNSVIRTQTTNVVNNKIQNTTITFPASSQTSVSTYNYLNNRISTIESFFNAILTTKTYFIYDASNKLIEYRTESFNNSGQIQSVNKHIFYRMQNIVYSNWTRSINSQSFVSISNAEIMLDQNLNRINFKEHDIVNNEQKKIVTVYDNNNNILTEEYFSLNSSGLYNSYLINSYSYGTAINTLAFINLQSIGKENIMLLYHLNSNAINEVNVKSFSPNVINTFISTFDDNIIFNIINQVDSNNYSRFSEYNCYNANNFISKFSFEFILN